MNYMDKLIDKRRVLMDRYVTFLQRQSLTVDEKEDKKRMSRELIKLDFEIEKMKDQHKAL